MYVFCRYYEEIPSYIKTVSEMEAYEEFLKQTMNQIQMQKARPTLISHHFWFLFFCFSFILNILTSFIILQQALEANHRGPQPEKNYLAAPLLVCRSHYVMFWWQISLNLGQSNCYPNIRNSSQKKLNWYKVFAIYFKAPLVVVKIIDLSWT